MNWVQLKMIRKGTKPPVWRRGVVPFGITFTQLAWILEELLDCEKTEHYEFEFYQKKITLCEWKEDSNFRKNFFYSYHSASDTFINELLSSEKRFAFRVQKDADQAAEYRIEIEKKLSQVSEKQKQEKVPIQYPLILKQVGGKGSWSDSVEKNGILREQYQVCSGEADYRDFRKLQKNFEEENRGIRTCENPRNRTGRNQLSFPEIINQCTDAEGIQPKELLNTLLGESLIQNGEKTREDQESRKPVLKDMLSGYQKAELVQQAKELRLHRARLKKDELAEKIANELLTPSVMKRRLLILGDWEIAAFEAAMKRKCFYPTDEEWEGLEVVFEMDYIACYQDEYVEVPGEVVQAYQAINTPEFHQSRKRVNWMLECLDIFGFLYAVAPVEIACEIYNRKQEFALSCEEFLERFKSLPEEINPCSLEKGKLMPTVLKEGRLYRNIERIQRQTDYYIPSEDEVHDYYKNRYMTGERTYWRLKEFFCRELDYDTEEADELCTVIYQEFAKGMMLSDIVGWLNENEMVFDSARQMEKFISLMADANNHTRMFELRGHMPVELSEAKPVLARNSRAKIVPMRGIPGSSEEPENKKIYPNDPCPCGSGKKYKKCCGKKV